MIKNTALAALSATVASRDFIFGEKTKSELHATATSLLRMLIRRKVKVSKYSSRSLVICVAKTDWISGKRPMVFTNRLGCCVGAILC